MEKYKIVFEFLNSLGEWIEADLDDSGKGFTHEEAEHTLNQLKYDEVCRKRNLRIELL